MGKYQSTGTFLLPSPHATLTVLEALATADGGAAAHAAAAIRHSAAVAEMMMRRTEECMVWLPRCWRGYAKRHNLNVTRQRFPLPVEEPINPDEKMQRGLMSQQLVTELLGCRRRW